MENVVYTIRNCPYCVMAKNLLDRLGIEYEERLVEESEEMLELKARYNWSTFPMVILNGKFLGGYQDTQALVDEGRMEEILSG
jgi:glutaredoxin 3